MSHFIKQGYIIELQKDIHEPIEHYQTRGLFVVSQKPKNINELKIDETYSRIYINKKYLKCEYSDDIEQILKTKIVNLST